MLLDVRSLTVELPTPTCWIRPVQDVSLHIAPGEALGLVGESGSGKTMLSLALMGLLPPGARVSGEAWFNVAETLAASEPASSATSANHRVNLLALEADSLRSLRGQSLAMIFQEPMTALNPVLRVGAQIEEAVRAHEPRLAREEVGRRTLAALERAAVPEPALRAHQFPHQLSCGLRQRALIAMALTGAPRLLIADEPTTALDVTVQKQILDLLARLQRDLGLALLFITHDLAVVAEVASRLIVLYAGRIVGEGPAHELLTHPRHPYTQGLLAASPSLDRKTLVPIPGNVPRLDALPPGCAFEPRCPLRRPECSAALPDLRAISEQRVLSEAEPRPASADHRARCILV